jgi:hypothetical protein
MIVPGPPFWQIFSATLPPHAAKHASAQHLTKNIFQKKKFPIFFPS